MNQKADAVKKTSGKIIKEPSLCRQEHRGGFLWPHIYPQAFAITGKRSKGARPGPFTGSEEHDAGLFRDDLPEIRHLCEKAGHFSKDSKPVILDFGIPVHDKDTVKKFVNRFFQPGKDV